MKLKNKIDVKALAKACKSAEQKELRECYFFVLLYSNLIPELVIAGDIIKTELDDRTKDYIYITADEAVRNKWVLKIELSFVAQQLFNFILLDDEKLA